MIYILQFISVILFQIGLPTAKEEKGTQQLSSNIRNNDNLTFTNLSINTIPGIVWSGSYYVLSFHCRRQ